MISDQAEAYARSHPEAKPSELMARFPSLERDEALMLKGIRSKPCGGLFGIKSFGNEMVGFGGRYVGNSYAVPIYKKPSRERADASDSDA